MGKAYTPALTPLILMYSDRSIIDRPLDLTAKTEFYWADAVYPIRTAVVRLLMGFGAMDESGRGGGPTAAVLLAGL
jgi:hypothetical protein